MEWRCYYYFVDTVSCQKKKSATLVLNMYEKWKESQYDSYNALNAKSSKTYKVPQDFTIRFSKSFSFAVGMDCRTGPRWPKAEDDELSRLVDRHGTESWYHMLCVLKA